MKGSRHDRFQAIILELTWRDGGKLRETSLRINRCHNPDSNGAVHEYKSEYYRQSYLPGYSLLKLRLFGSVVLQEQFENFRPFKILSVFTH